MGDIAEGLIDGTFDSITGKYLGEGHGYPRTREKDSGVHYYEKKETSGGAKVRGIQKWLKSKGIEPTDELLKEFLVEKKPNFSFTHYGNFRNKAVHISGNCFTDFANWIKENKL